MRGSQGEVFASSEGDNWFMRNREALLKWEPETDLPIKIMKLYGLRPKSVLEIGAANGYRLEAIRRRLGSRVVAVDVSAEAIRDGSERFPSVEFAPGRASAVPLRDPFELIILNFVFHWLDREKLIASFAEVDRLLVDGGYLIIGDFYPTTPTKVQYHHLPNERVYTYKQDYAAPFVASGLYRAVCLLTRAYSEEDLGADVGDHDRSGAWLLRKSLEELYVEARSNSSKGLPSVSP